MQYVSGVMSNGQNIYRGGFKMERIAKALQKKEKLLKFTEYGVSVYDKNNNRNNRQKFLKKITQALYNFNLPYIYVGSFPSTAEYISNKEDRIMEYFGDKCKDRKTDLNIDKDIFSNIESTIDVDLAADIFIKYKFYLPSLSFINNDMSTALSSIIINLYKKSMLNTEAVLNLINTEDEVKQNYIPKYDTDERREFKYAYLKFIVTDVLNNFNTSSSFSLTEWLKNPVNGILVENPFVEKTGIFIDILNFSMMKYEYYKLTPKYKINELFLLIDDFINFDYFRSSLNTLISYKKEYHIHIIAIDSNDKIESKPLKESVVLANE